MSRGVLYNVPTVINQMNAHIDTFRAVEGVAAVEADVVAHSMGALVTRAFTVYDPSNSSFAFAQGGVHKLISLDTPYLGSVFADRVVHNTPINCSIVFSAQGKSLSQDVRDLVPDSAILVSLNKAIPGATHIQAHAVVGSASLAQTTAAENCYYGNNPNSPKACKAFAFACQNLLPAKGGFTSILGANSDLIVANTSQSASGLGIMSTIPTSTPTASVIHSVVPAIFPIGPDVLGQALQNGDQTVDSTAPTPTALIVNHVIDLLNAPLTVGGQFAPITP
jgi:hypothetical protein